jgi:hypothetical protein
MVLKVTKVKVYPDGPRPYNRLPSMFRATWPRIGGSGPALLAGCLVALALSHPAAAQAPTGAVTGVVTDPSGGTLAKVDIEVVNLRTGDRRTMATTSEGVYSMTLLPPGAYRLSTDFAGFARIERTVTVAAGMTTSADLQLPVGDVSETVTVSGADPLIQREGYQIGGVVARNLIDRLPLNGLNFLELAKLEPGVTPPVRGNNNRIFVAALGSGVQSSPRVGDTRTTVDGASVNFVGSIGAALQVPRHAVEEFQIATVNFEPAASVTTSGTINVVTRAGANVFQGEAFVFYRSHQLAAYPGLTFDPLNPDPFFERAQFGGSAGGAMRKNRVFAFGSYERTDQTGVVSVQPATQEFAGLGGIFRSPAAGFRANARIDLRLNRRNRMFIRSTFDDNSGFAPANDRTDPLPSAWSHTDNHVHQTLVALTSVLSSRVVNDFRVSNFFLTSPERPPTAADCPAPCVGLGAPRIVVQSAALSVGNARTVSFTGQRHELTDEVAWQWAAHRLLFGVDWEHSTNTSSLLTLDPAQITVFAPGTISDPTIPILASYHTVSDLLSLPLKSVTFAVGPAESLQRNFGAARVLDQIRLYAGDVWHLARGVTASGGLTWSYEPNALNTDLTKPALLIPILGADGLGPPRIHPTVSATAGFAWTVARGGKTVVRGGGGRYYDPYGSANPISLTNERALLSPLGTGRVTASGANISNPGICAGAKLNFPAPTTCLGSDLVAGLDGLRARRVASLNPGNRDFSVTNLDGFKEAATDLFAPGYETPSAIHLALGIQHEFGRGFVLSADVAWKRFSHTSIDGIDFNRFNSVAKPLIPTCTAPQKADVHAACSNGPMLFDTTIGRARYRGLLVRLEKRLSTRGQVLFSYALGSYTGSNGTAAGLGFNNDNWLENDGPLPTDARHVLNVAGVLTLPWGLAASLNISAHSAPPFSVFVGSMDFNGDGTTSDLLPGTTVGAFGRGLGKSDLVRLVDAYNRDFAGQLFGSAQTMAKTLTLPSSYSFGDGVFTTDMRITKFLRLGRAGPGLEIFAEIFNLFNTANLLGFSGDLTNPATFGQPTGLTSQVFGSGGPRAVQLGGRITF